MLPFLLAVRASTEELKRGDTLGRYEIIERVAVGGMAEIYLGRVRGTNGFDKLVAVKRVLPHIAMDQSFLEMFIAEARLAATLRHSNIADVFDVGEANGSYFFAMEFIHGQDVRSIRYEASERKQKVPIEVSLAITSGIASALAYTHSRVGPNGAPLKLVHRDVSPSNILVSYDGAVKLVDFGIARAETNTAATRTRTGQLRGKIPYMSPEQCRAKQLDGRTDLFSLGTVLYELTTGERPFDGKGEFDTLERIVHGTMRPPSEIDPMYPKALEAIVMKMLANKRSDRYQTAEQLLADLEHVQTENSWFASALHVGKYMRELFPEEMQRLPNLDDDDDEAPTLGAERDVLIELADPDPDPGPQPTSSFKVVFRAPTSDRASSQIEATPFPIEVATDELTKGDTTRADLLPPFDPIARRSSEMLATIDPDIVDDKDISIHTIGELLQRAVTASESGDNESAIIAIDLVLSADRRAPGMLDLLAKNFPFMTAIFESFIGDTTRMLAFMEQSEQIAEMPLDRRAVYLLSLIEGSMTAGELLARADMPAVEAYRHLSQLLLRRVVMLV